MARPLNALFLLALVAGLLGASGRKRAARWLFGFCALSTAAIGFTQLPDVLLYGLETRVPAATLPADPAGIIVLGGGLGTESAAWPDGYQVGESSDRLIRALELKRRYPDARMIYSGGLSTMLQRGRPETEAARHVIEALYGDTRGIEFESASRNTWENALFVSRLVGGNNKRPWILVTSAFHMPRALGCFRRVGMNVVAAPADFRADRLRFPWLTGAMANQFLKMNILAKELLGLLAYRLTGRIGTLLPR